MFNIAGARASLLNGKVRAATRYNMYDESFGHGKKQKVGFSVLQYESLDEDDKQIVVVYVVDMKLHESRHDEVMMQHLNLVMINVNIRHTKVIFKNHEVDKNKFNKIYNLIKLNLPDAVIDVFPKDVKTIYDYIENLDDDDYHYITFHPYVENVEVMDVLFEYTLLNVDDYRRSIAYYKTATQPAEYSFLSLGFFLHPSRESFWFDYAWITKWGDSKKKRMAKSIVRFDGDRTFSSIDQIENSEFASI